MNDDRDTRYNQVRQKGSHNSYERTEGYDDQAIYWRLRSVELDIHNGKACSFRPALDGDWYVYHYCGPGGTSTSVDKLSDGLDTQVAFLRAVPQHEAMTLFLDLKDNFDDTHTPEDLDQLLVEKLGRDRIWGPPDLIAATGAGTLQEAIGEGGWPLLADLRGKFLVALTGGGVDDPGSKLNQYVDGGATADQRLAFVAPEIQTSDQITEKPYVVFFNLDGSHRSLGRDVFEAAFVSRTWGLDSSSSWDEAVAAQIHHLATNKVNSVVDPWARTDNGRGYPFEGIEVDLDPELVEPGSIYGIEVTSGDLWGKEDSFYFAYDSCSGDAVDGIRESFISSPASHVQSWAKGALMARATLEPDSPYFGVIRTGTKDLRVQYRLASGDDTRAEEVDIVPPKTVDENTLIWVRLEIADGGTTARGWGSLTGTDWTLISEQHFDQPLVFQGWGASSHGEERVKFLFGSPEGEQVTLASRAAIGDGASGEYFAGIYPF